MKTKINKSMWVAILTFVATLSNLLQKIESHWSLANLISIDKTNEQKKILNPELEMVIQQINSNFIYEVIFSTVLIIVIGILIYIHFRNQEKTLDYIDTAIEFEGLINENTNVANQRKRQYLYDCIRVGGIIEEPKEYLTEHERKLVEREAKRLLKDLTKFRKIIGYKFTDDEHSRNNK